jgi:SAM-dependent methyltransferase
MASCRICAGDLELRVRGNGAALTAAALSPSAHAVGRHGDLLACRECGTVQQPVLPSGEPLHELYREMRDDEYLGEEAGRRATANRLLDLIAAHVPSGRLLDVGCGHGLLLDEARRRGYEVEGLELSDYAAAHARDTLRLPVRQATVADVAAGPEPPAYAAIVLADVLEHLDDPLATVDTCARLLAPGGVLCLVTPDPGSRTARFAGARWWGFLPAHTFLLPRRTLRDLLDRRGLDVADDLPLVRTFSLRYWMAGFAERGGAIGAAVNLVRRVVPARASLSLSLGDERVLVARRGARYATVGAGGAGSSAPAAVGSPTSAA